MATLAIIPKLYIGWITQFLKDYKQFEFSDKSFDYGLAWHVTDHKILERNGCAMSNAEGVVTEIWKMCFAREARSLIKFEDILRSIVDLDTAWSKASVS